MKFTQNCLQSLFVIESWPYEQTMHIPERLLFSVVKLPGYVTPSCSLTKAICSVLSSGGSEMWQAVSRSLLNQYTYSTWFRPFPLRGRTPTYWRFSKIEKQPLIRIYLHFFLDCSVGITDSITSGDRLNHQTGYLHLYASHYLFCYSVVLLFCLLFFLMLMVLLLWCFNVVLMRCHFCGCIKEVMLLLFIIRRPLAQ